MREVFLNPKRKSQTRNAIPTLAWSLGKDASGMCSKISFPAFFILSSGLSRCTNCWIIVLIMTAKTIVYVINRSFIFQKASCLKFAMSHITTKNRGTKNMGISAIKKTIFQIIVLSVKEFMYCKRGIFIVWCKERKKSVIKSY